MTKSPPFPPIPQFLAAGLVLAILAGVAGWWWIPPSSVAAAKAVSHIGWGLLVFSLVLAAINGIGQLVVMRDILARYRFYQDDIDRLIARLNLLRRTVEAAEAPVVNPAAKQELRH